MRFPLDEQLAREAEQFQLRSACRDCIHQHPGDESCTLGWPNQEQRRWPLWQLAPADRPREVHFCKEFELA